MATSTNQAPSKPPVVALTLGDPAGIGPELCAKLLSVTSVTAEARVVLVGDSWLWREGQKAAGVNAPIRVVDSIPEAVDTVKEGDPVFVPMDTVGREQITLGKACSAGGRSVIDVLDRVVDHSCSGVIDSICFAPLNKNAMKQGGLQFEDELHHFADRLCVSDYVCELNVLDKLWTSRITSHIALKDVPAMVTLDRVKKAARLIYRTLHGAGLEQPRVAVAALNPHGGDGGAFGREEIEIIEPAIQDLNKEGMPISGPFPADTIFLKARDGNYDAIVTMYHDQGQIALKLMGFERGVTVQGGLPVPITTPAHGTAYDIAGRGQANVEAIKTAFLLAVRMGMDRRNQNQPEFV